MHINRHNYNVIYVPMGEIKEEAMSQLKPEEHAGSNQHEINCAKQRGLESRANIVISEVELQGCSFGKAPSKLLICYLNFECIFPK